MKTSTLEKSISMQYELSWNYEGTFETIEFNELYEALEKIETFDNDYKQIELETYIINNTAKDGEPYRFLIERTEF